MFSATLFKTVEPTQCASVAEWIKNVIYSYNRKLFINYKTLMHTTVCIIPEIVTEGKAFKVWPVGRSIHTLLNNLSPRFYKEAQQTHWFPKTNHGGIMQWSVIGTLGDAVGIAHVSPWEGILEIDVILSFQKDNCFLFRFGHTYIGVSWGLRAFKTHLLTAGKRGLSSLAVLGGVDPQFKSLLWMCWYPWLFPIARHQAGAFSFYHLFIYLLTHLFSR